jgi:hypothetical protein
MVARDKSGTDKIVIWVNVPLNNWSHWPKYSRWKPDQPDQAVRGMQ